MYCYPGQDEWRTVGRPDTPIPHQKARQQHQDFPLVLQNQIETEWQKWQEKGAADEVVVNYVWPSANMVTHYERVVRRLVDPS